MKYFTIGISFLAALLAASILAGVLVASWVKPANSHLTRAVDALAREDYDNAVEQAIAAEKKWKAEQQKLSAFLSHETLEEVAVAFSDLHVYSERQNYSEFLARCKLLQMQLKHISEMDIPYYYNLL